MHKKTVITGIGVLASNGAGKKEFWDSLNRGVVGCAPVTLFPSGDLKCPTACEVKNFEPKDYFGPKGLRTLDRSTKLLVSASKLLLQDCGLNITEDNADDIGVSAGCALGSFDSINELFKCIFAEGPCFVNPALFPNTVINSPASQVSIWNNIRGFNTTLSSGFTASTDAVGYACDFIRYGRAKAVLAGGVEEMCYYTMLGFQEAGFLSGSRDSTFINCPFDPRRNGITFGEGAALAMIEDEEYALQRGADILAEVKGFGQRFDSRRPFKYDIEASGLVSAIKLALEDADLREGDIDCVYANANSTNSGDAMEVSALNQVFKNGSPPVTAIKSMIGETFGASGAFALSAAVGCLITGQIPPTVNFERSENDAGLDIISGRSREIDAENILLINYGPEGYHSCLVISRYKGGKV